MDDLYLIAHKVRGEPALDIAIRLEGSGTESDPGPWWIVSTSGHRAYPYWWAPLTEILDDGASEVRDQLKVIRDLMPDIRDHYELSADSFPHIRPRTSPRPTLDDLL